MSLTNTSLSLGSGGNVVMTASGPNELTLSGPGPSDVDVTGVDTFTFLGELNTGTSAFGGYLFFGRGDRSSTAAAPWNYSFGSNSTTNPNLGMYIPFAGTAVFFGYDAQNTATCTIELRGSVSGTLMTLSLSAETTKTSTTPAAFVGNEYFTINVTAGTPSTNSRVLFILRFN